MRQVTLAPRPRARGHRLLPPAVCAALLVTALAACSSGGVDGTGSAAPPSSPASGPDGSGLFAADSVWHQQVPASAPLDPGSDAEVHQLLTKKPLVSVNGWTVAVYDADASTKTYTVTAKHSEVHTDWSMQVPIPDGAEPDPEQDGHLAVIDHADQCVYELYQAKHYGDTWSASWVNATPADGPGTYPDGVSARGTGISAAAGLIWPQELAAGHIDHALVFAEPDTRSGGQVPPATAHDGHSDDPGSLPEGAHLRLDPSLDLSTLNLTPEQHTIAVALQQYGMYLADTAGGFTLYAAAPQSYPTFPYPASWSSDTWADISAIPFDHLQVLAMPAPAPRYQGPVVTNRCNAAAQHGPNPTVGDGG